MTRDHLIACESPYPPETIKEYFGRDADGHLARIMATLEDAQRFLRANGREALVGRKAKPAEYARDLQFFKDETSRMLYAFVSVHPAGGERRAAESARHFRGLLQKPFPAIPIAVSQPRVAIEKQVTAPEGVQDHTSGRVRAGA